MVLRPRKGDDGARHDVRGTMDTMPTRGASRGGGEEWPEAYGRPASLCRGCPRRLAAGKMNRGVREVRAGKGKRGSQGGAAKTNRGGRNRRNTAAGGRDSGEKIRRPGGTIERGRGGERERRPWAL